ncbi:MAG: type II toxin-antitoxin system RelE/ParE family toxin [Planctomycetales bacterium]|nr:type II toxin-antitoxin system RelE/ParE family toxin [Planctomycetales bacterium]
MSDRKTKANLLLTERALHDISEIEQYSTEQFGKKAASKYISDIEAALARLQESPKLLRVDEGLHPKLQLYQVNKHLLVCDVQQNTTFLLTVIHASRDIPSRLAEMQPNLAVEVEILHQKLATRKKKR